MKVVRKCSGFAELTPTLLREFMEKVIIHKSEALEGKRWGGSADRKSKFIILLSER